MLKPKDPGRWSHLKLAHLTVTPLRDQRAVPRWWLPCNGPTTTLRAFGGQGSIPNWRFWGVVHHYIILYTWRTKLTKITGEYCLKANCSATGTKLETRPAVFQRNGTLHSANALTARDDNEDYEKVPLHEILREEGSALSRVPRIPWFSGKQTLNCENINFCDRQDMTRFSENDYYFLLWGYPTSPGHDKVCWDAAWKHLGLSGSKIHGDQPS